MKRIRPEPLSIVEVGCRADGAELLEDWRRFAADHLEPLSRVELLAVELARACADADVHWSELRPYLRAQLRPREVLHEHDWIDLARLLPDLALGPDDGARLTTQPGPARMRAALARVRRWEPSQ